MNAVMPIPQTHQGPDVCARCQIWSESAAYHGRIDHFEKGIAILRAPQWIGDRGDHVKVGIIQPDDSVIELPGQILGMLPSADDVTYTVRLSGAFASEKAVDQMIEAMLDYASAPVRAEPRIPQSWSVRGESSGGFFFEAESTDVSLNGIGLTLEEYFPPDTTLFFDVEVENPHHAKIQLCGQVRHICPLNDDDGFRVGIQLDEQRTPPECMSYYKGLIQRLN